MVLILERYARAFRAHLLELTVRLPRVCPSSVIGRIADCVVDNRLDVVRRQLILPVGIAVGVGIVSTAVPTAPVV